MVNYTKINADDWADGAAHALQGGDRQLVALFANDERPVRGEMAVYALFLDKQAGDFVGIRTSFDARPWQLPSLVSLIPAAAWYEREMHDLFGIYPQGHPDLRPLVLHENWPAGVHPLCKDFPAHAAVPVVNTEFPVPAVAGEGVFEVPVGPIHAGIIEPGHFRFSQAGEHIINLEAKLFYTHRGIEKAVEGQHVERAYYQVERICGACAVSHALSYCQALETLANLEITPEAEYARVIAAELERLYNHVGDAGNLCAGLAFAVGISHGARMKESLMRLNELIAGNRFLRGLVVPGGVGRAFDDKTLATIDRVLSKLEPDFRELIGILRENEAFLDRVNTTGIVPYEAAIDLALVGVGARASGVNSDVRRDAPYGAYSQLAFKVPVFEQGDVAARLWVRAEEVFQSISLIRQAGKLLLDAGREWRRPLPDLPSYRTAVGWSESARGSNVHWLMTGENNTLYRLFVRSASYPNWPALAVAAPGNIIPDFPLINKSFELCYACIDR